MSIISISSIVSAKDHKPYVHIEWEQLKCQLTVEEAQQHAYNILACCNAAEMDACLIKFLNEKVGLKDVDMAKILYEFRQYREQDAR